MGLPLVDLPARKAEIDVQLRARLQEVFANPAFIGRPAAGQNEHTLCSAAGSLGVAKGTDAVVTALFTIGARPTAEVFTLAHTSITTALAASRMGASPVCIDINPDHLPIHPDPIVEQQKRVPTALAAPWP